MTRPRVAQVALDFLRQNGPSRPKDVGLALLQHSDTRSRLSPSQLGTSVCRRLVELGDVEVVDRGLYRATLKPPLRVVHGGATATRSAEIDWNQLVGVPLIGAMPVDQVRQAIDSLLAAGKILAQLEDVATGPALEFVQGAGTDISRIGGMLRNIEATAIAGVSP